MGARSQLTRSAALTDSVPEPSAAAVANASSDGVASRLHSRPASMAAPSPPGDQSCERSTAGASGAAPAARPGTPSHRSPAGTFVPAGTDDSAVMYAPSPIVAPPPTLARTSIVERAPMRTAD